MDVSDESMNGRQHDSMIVGRYDKALETNHELAQSFNATVLLSTYPMVILCTAIVDVRNEGFKEESGS